MNKFIDKISSQNKLLIDIQSDLESTEKQLKELKIEKLKDKNYTLLRVEEFDFKIFIPSHLAKNEYQILQLLQGVPNIEQRTKSYILTYFVNSKDLQDVQQSKEYKKIIDKRMRLINKRNDLLSEIVIDGKSDKSISNSEIINEIQTNLDIPISENEIKDILNSTPE